MTRYERQKVITETTERVLDEVESMLVEHDRGLWDGEQLNIRRCMEQIRERLLTPPGE